MMVWRDQVALATSPAVAVEATVARTEKELRRLTTLVNNRGVAGGAR